MALTTVVDTDVDVARSLGVLRRGPGDPCQQHQPGVIWRTAPTPDGPASLRLSIEDSSVAAEAFGPGARWMLDSVPGLVGEFDDPSGFEPAHEPVRQAWLRYPGVRLVRTGLVFDQLVPSILEQLVAGLEAHRAWRELLRRYGTPAPGPAPAGMRVAPYPRQLLSIPDWGWHQCGIDGARRRTILRAASVASRMDQCASMSIVDAVARLKVVPGVGPWTAAETVQRALGAPDEVSVGDYNLPSMVGWTLFGRAMDDTEMLTALKPYAPHRQRAMRYIELIGRMPPRRAPRATLRNYRGM